MPFRRVEGPALIQRLRFAIGAYLTSMDSGLKTAGMTTGVTAGMTQWVYVLIFQGLIERSWG
jgi:hypothetical protein